MSKKYIGNGFVGGYENSANIEISLTNLCTELGLNLNQMKNAFAPLYNAQTKEFSTPAIYIKKWQRADGTKVEELVLKIQTGQVKDSDRLFVALNEFVKQAGAAKVPKEPKGAAPTPHAPSATQSANYNDEPPF